MTGNAGPTNTVASLAGVFHSLVSGKFAESGLDDSLLRHERGHGMAENRHEQLGRVFHFRLRSLQGGRLPPGLTLSSDGTISGTPTSAGTNGIFNFTVAAEDTSSNTAVQPLSITVTGTAETILSSATLMQSSNTFQMQINGVQAGYNYTVQMSTNLASTNWTAIFTTNAPGTNALLIPDANATNQARFYRVQVVP